MNNNAKKCVRSEEKTLRKASLWVSKNWVTILSAVALMTVLCVGFAFADNAEEMWKSMVALISKWVTRLGGLVIFVGGVMFGLGWKREDADGKSQGISTMIAGAIVTAVAGMTNFFA